MRIFSQTGRIMIGEAVFSVSVENLCVFKQEDPFLDKQNKERSHPAVLPISRNFGRVTGKRPTKMPATWPAVRFL
jgi:hypothetical protein